MFYTLMGYAQARVEWRLRAIRNLVAGERGQGTVEYVGLILLVSLLMVGMVAAMKGFNRFASKTSNLAKVRDGTQSFVFAFVDGYTRSTSRPKAGQINSKLLSVVNRTSFSAHSNAMPISPPIPLAAWQALPLVALGSELSSAFRAFSPISRSSGRSEASKATAAVSARPCLCARKSG